MANYKRNVTYFYRYQNGVVGSTAGFLKMEIRGDKVKITINIQESNYDRKIDPDLCFYHEAGDYLNAVKVCDVKRESGVLTLQTKTDWQSMFDTERDLYSFDGAIVYYNDNDYYLGDFSDRDRKSYEVKFLKKKNIPENNYNKDDDSAIEAKSENKIDKRTEYTEDFEEPEKVSKPEYINRDNVKTADSFDSMIADYPKLPMYGVSELFDCVRIHPRDIGKLDIGNWKLGVNSFLTHGYYTYQYLMLGNMRFGDGRKHPVLGVPGVYNNREKYIANMFGFDQFIPVKKTGEKTGQFGYWIVELNERNV